MAALTEGGAPVDEPELAVPPATPLDVEVTAEEQLESSTVRARAVAGASAMVVRGFAVRGIGLLGNLVLARLLAPEDFGLAALGVTILTFGNALAEGGIAAGFVRGHVAPTRTDLAAAVSIQAWLSTAIVAVCAAAALIVGTREAAIALVMVASMPLMALRTPAFIHFERALDFTPLVRVEIAETLSYFVFAVTSVALGAGVWGLAIAQCVRTATGAAMMVASNPTGWVAPRWNTASIRRMIGFGAKFQGMALASLALAQGMNVAIAAAAGLAGLGIWALVSRLLQIPLMVFQSLRRVSYPAVARLMTTGDDLGPVLLRSAKLACVLGGVMVVGVLAASEPGVVLAFGERWEPAQTLLPLSVSVVFVNGPVSVAAFSYVLASGRAGVGLTNSLVQAALGPLIVIVGYPWVGLDIVAAASLALAVMEATIFGIVLWRGLRVNLLPVMLGYAALVALAGGGGHLVATDLPESWLAVILGIAVAEVAFIGALALLQRDVFRDAIGLGRRALARA